MTGSIHYWLRLVVLLFVSFDVLLIVGWLVIYLFALTTNVNTINILKRIHNKTFVCVLFFCIGYGFCDVWRYGEIKTVKGPITILNAYAHNEYKIDTPQYGELRTRLCDPAPQFQKGHILNYIKYRYNYPQGCWMVNHSGGFDVFVSND